MREVVRTESYYVTWVKLGNEWHRLPLLDDAPQEVDYAEAMRRYDATVADGHAARVTRADVLETIVLDANSDR